MLDCWKAFRSVFAWSRWIPARELRCRDGPAGQPVDAPFARIPKSAGTGASALSARLAGRNVIVTLGAGGVGKTTTSAALALGLAMRGSKVAVVTIDPARRLATALGLERLSGEPHRIEAEMLESQGLKVRGELWAMMLDTKATFDAVVERLAPDESSREEILANPVYRELSTAVSGSNELSAIAKLYELHEEHEFDVIVLDTPPSRNALGLPRSARAGCWASWTAVHCRCSSRPAASPRSCSAVARRSCSRSSRA